MEYVSEMSMTLFYITLSNVYLKHKLSAIYINTTNTYICKGQSLYYTHNLTPQAFKNVATK